MRNYYYARVKEQDLQTQALHVGAFVPFGQDEIRQLYSFRIGQYGRVCDVNPSRKAYLRMIQMYEDGFPGDGPERRADFALKAQKYYKKIEAMG